MTPLPIEPRHSGEPGPECGETLDNRSQFWVAGVKDSMGKWGIDRVERAWGQREERLRGGRHAASPYGGLTASISFSHRALPPVAFVMMTIPVPRRGSNSE
jgi:hypothetical protein